ncbi:MAG: hypothetical protein DI571_07795 [Arsenicicoccus sp.]|nr:MAG: hypothetical protein DI571_07795 [Arsenicicoccus sp.]
MTSAAPRVLPGSRAARAAPVRIGDPGYAAHLDRDGDRVRCE